MTRAAGNSTHYTLSVIDREGRIVPGPDLSLVSVTTISGLLKDSGPLIAWSHRLTVDGVAALAALGYDGSTFADANKLRAILKEHGHTPWSQRDSAASRGTDVHAYFEARMKGATGASLRKDYPAEQQGYLDGIDAWIADNKVEPIYVERVIVSLDHRFAGTVDLVARRGGEVWLTDLKTSKAIYDSHFTQLGGYALALAEEASHDASVPEIDAVSVLRVGADGTYEEQHRHNFGGDMEQFLMLRRLYDLINQTKGGK